MMVEVCSNCGSTNVEYCLYRSESFSPTPFAQYYCTCKDCNYFWFSRDESGKGVL